MISGKATRKQKNERLMMKLLLADADAGARVPALAFEEMTAHVRSVSTTAERRHGKRLRSRRLFI
ncbi:hypothetical protein CCR94_21260 [Rhodoblastus sphagnicola]|uniref:Uncharacterized protein n=1 Tax=Rhodoblastus sphagnicola TaxID=333368 RepID=A0A2S6MX59_9HYPH|nr:hypothetical protein CCR94_21260 [Rhodoblastus sphagnicola]